METFRFAVLTEVGLMYVCLVCGAEAWSLEAHDEHMKTHEELE